VRRAVPTIVEIYGSFDPRSLGLGRIGLGLLLLWDLLRRVPDLSNWYSNDGLLPNHTVLWRPSSEYVLSFLLAASRPEEAALMFVLCGLVFFVFTLGWHTRFFHVLSFLCLISLHNRVIFLENGGDVALNVLCALTMFLPMGARFSIDAVRASLAARRERTVDELNGGSVTRLHTSATRPVTSLAVFALLLQLAVIYYFNAVNKHGWTWRRGSAIHYVLYQERMVTWLGLWVRPYITPLISRVLTYLTLAVEYLAPILILNPVGSVWSRRIAVLSLPVLHLAFAAGLNLGQFSFNMMGFFPLLLSAADWDVLGRRLRPMPGRARTVYVNETSALGCAWARFLSRLDAFDLLRFVSHREADHPVDHWGVEDPVTHRRTSGAHAAAECWAALPLGLPLAAFLRLPGVRTLGDFIGSKIVARRDWLARAFRWSPLDGTQRQVDPPRPPPARAWLRHKLAWVRELSVIVLLAAGTTQLLVENRAIPKALKLPQPRWMQQIVVYPRLLQGWQMFSADVPTGERMLYFDAVTVSGRHVDPFNEAGSRVATLPVERIPPHMEQDEFWCDYTNRIPENQAYWRALKEWIFDYYVRTARPEDRIVSFEARLLESESPPPGETSPRNMKTKVIMQERE